MNQENQTIEKIMHEEAPIRVVVAGPEHAPYGQEICDMIEESAKARKTGIAKRTADYIIKKLNNQKL